MKKNMTTTRTASWQFDSADYADGMDNKDHPSYKAHATGGNQHLNRDPNKNINVGRGPTVGNKGDMVTPGTRALVSPNKKSSDTINYGKQERTPGGTRKFEPSAGQNYHGNADAINFGRGPTKGNQC